MCTAPHISRHQSLRARERMYAHKGCMHTTTHCPQRSLPLSFGTYTRACEHVGPLRRAPVDDVPSLADQILPIVVVDILPMA